MNKNSPMVQEFILGAAAPHFYYPPDTYVIEDIWSDTDDDEENHLNHSYRNVLASAEMLDEIVTRHEMTVEGRMSKAARPPRYGPPTLQTRPQGGRVQVVRGRKLTDEEQRQWREQEAEKKKKVGTLGGMTTYGLPERETVFPAYPSSRIAESRTPLSYATGAQVRQTALRQGFSPSQASEMGDAAYYKMQSAEDRIGRRQAGRALLGVGLLGAAGIAPGLFPETKNMPVAARIGIMASVAGASALAESGLPDGVIRSYVQKKMLESRRTPGQVMSDHTDQMMRRYGGIAHTPERNLMELAATRTPTNEQAKKTVYNQRKNQARENALKALDVKDDVRKLYEVMGSTPPSKGYITSSKTGRVLAHATGNTADYYPPFTMKQMSGRARQKDDKFREMSAVKGGLRGNDYIRSRSIGGLTPEDIRTGLVFGARKVEVLGPDGAEWIKFTDKAQNAKSLIPGKNLHISRIPKQYQDIKTKIAKNAELNELYKSDHDKHNAAIAYLAWKHPKFIVGPETNAPKPLKGTKAEQTPYVEVAKIKRAASYGQVRSKIEQSLKSTKLPDGMKPYTGPTHGKTARQKVAENKLVKPGIDQGRKVGAKGAVTALRAGTAKDRDQAKKILAESGLYSKETNKFITAKARRAAAAEAAKKPLTGAVKTTGTTGGAKPLAVSLRQAGATSQQINSQRGIDWQRTVDEAFRKKLEAVKDVRNISKEDFIRSIKDSAAAKFRNLGTHGEMQDHELTAITAAIGEKYDRIKANQEEKAATAKSEDKVYGVPRKQLTKSVSDLVEGAIGRDLGSLDTMSQRAKFVANAAERLTKGLKLDKESVADADALLLQIAGDVNESLGEPEPDEAQIAMTRGALAAKFAQRATNAGTDPGDYPRHRDMLAGLFGDSDVIFPDEDEY